MKLKARIEALTIKRILGDIRVESISDERYGSNDDGFWVYLHSGWNNGDGGEHAIHCDTPEECARELHCVEVCKCRDCEHDRKAWALPRNPLTPNRQ